MEPLTSVVIALLSAVVGAAVAAAVVRRSGAGAPPAEGKGPAAVIAAAPHPAQVVAVAPAAPETKSAVETPVGDMTMVESTEDKWQGVVNPEELQKALRSALAAEAERDDLLGERSDLQKQLSSALADSRSARDQQKQAEQALAARDAESKVKGDAAAAELRAAEKALKDTEAQRDQVKTQLQATERQLVAANSQASNLTSDLQRVRREVDEERQARQAAEAEVVAQRDLEESLTELRTTLSDHERWLGDERQRAAALAVELSGLQQHRQKVRQLATQLREARAKLANQSGAFDMTALLLMADSVISVAELDEVVADWQATPGVRSIAVTTGSGLAVASGGEFAPWLAALAAEIDRAVAQASPWLAAHMDLGAPDLVQVRDRHGGALTLRRWDGLAEPLLLSVLSSAKSAKDPAKVVPFATLSFERSRTAAAGRIPRLTPVALDPVSTDSTDSATSTDTATLTDTATSTDTATATAPIERSHA